MHLWGKRKRFLQDTQKFWAGLQQHLWVKKSREQLTGKPSLAKDGGPAIRAGPSSGWASSCNGLNCSPTERLVLGSFPSLGEGISVLRIPRAVYKLNSGCG